MRRIRLKELIVSVASSTPSVPTPSSGSSYLSHLPTYPDRQVSTHDVPPPTSQTARCSPANMQARRPAFPIWKWHELRQGSEAEYDWRTDGGRTHRQR